MLHLDLGPHRLYHHENDGRQAKLAMLLTAVMAIVSAVLITAALFSTRACQV